MQLLSPFTQKRVIRIDFPQRNHGAATAAKESNHVKFPKIFFFLVIQ